MEKTELWLIPAVEEILRDLPVYIKERLQEAKVENQQVDDYRLPRELVYQALLQLANRHCFSNNTYADKAARREARKLLRT